MSDSAFQRASYRWLHRIGQVSRMSDEQLRQFVNDYCSGRIFTNWDIPNVDLVRMVFVPIGLGAFTGWKKEDLGQLGCVYERIDKAAPRGINGLPMFFSMRMMHTEDWARAIIAINRELNRRENIEV